MPKAKSIPAKTVTYTEQPFEPFDKLNQDLLNAAKALTRQEARYFVDRYYQIQEERKRTDNQLRAAAEQGEPSALLVWDSAQIMKREKAILKALSVFGEQSREGRWLMSQHGIGPVMTAGLLAYIDITKAPTPSSLWSFCFPAGTLVNTPGYPMPIEDIVAGDEVIDKDGNRTQVLNAFKRPYDGDVITIKPRGCLALTATPEHPFYVKKNKDTQPSWIDAKEVQVGMYLALPKRCEYDVGDLQFSPSNHAKGKSPFLTQPVDIDEDFAWFAGLFVADGHATLSDEHGYRRGSSRITFAYDDDSAIIERALIIAKRFGGAYLHTSPEKEGGKHVCFGRVTVAQGFQNWFGHMAQNKCIPPQILGHPDMRIPLAFLEGYLCGDGHRIPHEGRHKGRVLANTVSHVLALQLQQLCARLGVFVVINYQRRHQTISEIRGHAITQLPYRYNIAIRNVDIERVRGNMLDDPMYTNRRPLKDETHFWTQITGVENEPYSGMVYNLETASHTYCVENIATHNCGYNPQAKWLGREKATALYHEVRETFPKRGVKLESILPALEAASHMKAQSLERWARAYHKDGELTAENLVKALSRCPWNMQLKVLCFKICEYGFVRPSTGPKASLYSLTYRARKLVEVERNLSGYYKDAAARALVERTIRDSDLRATYEAGKLPDGQIDRRARIYALKLFLSHVHHVFYECHYSKPPPLPYIFEKDPRHTKYVPPSAAGWVSSLTPAQGPRAQREEPAFVPGKPSPQPCCTSCGKRYRLEELAYGICPQCAGR